MIRSMHQGWSAKVVADPDAILIQPGAFVATTDAGVFDRCAKLVNLGRALVEAGVPSAFVVDLK
jgi:hypothetical protein